MTMNKNEYNIEDISFEEILKKLTLEDKIILMDKFLLAFYNLAENLGETFLTIDNNE